MNVPAEFAKQFAKFSEALRKLVEAELKDGNSIVEICGGFPAAPCGDCLKLAKPVSESRRKSKGGIHFYERNSSDYCGEFTDEKRHFFVLEPPKPPEPEPDMNAIREEREARQRAADAALYAAQEKKQAKARKTSRKTARDAGSAGKVEFWQPPTAPASAEPAGTVARFVESMKGSFEQWHDGTGYDLEALKSATPEELVEIEDVLLKRPVEDWRDVEALAALDSPRARVVLRKALKSGNHRVATGVAQHAPDLISDSERADTLVAALEGSETYGGLTQALLEVEEFHPPKVIAALFRGVLNREGENAVHFAAMLMFVHGKAESSFDWNHRPLFLRFNTEDRAERESAFRELCEKIGVEPEQHIKAARGGAARKSK